MQRHQQRSIGFPAIVAAALLLALPLVTRAGTGATTRVSVASDGAQGNSFSGGAAISGDGRYVVFNSFASNLVSGDTNGYWDVFVRDTQSGATSRVSLSTAGAEGNENATDYSVISADGRTVAFSSWASNLVGGDTNDWADVFVHDIQTGTTSRISVASGGTQGNDGSGAPAISSDGRFVAFSSAASNLVDGDTNAQPDVFLHDMQTGITGRVSVASNGAEANGPSGLPSLSADGRYMAFTSNAANLVAGDTNGFGDVFVHDRLTGATTRVSLASGGTQANDDAGAPAISGDGRYVAFASQATNLVAGDTNAAYDVFLRDTQSGVTTRISVASDGAQANNGSGAPAISADGRYVAFSSTASNLAGDDRNGEADIFVHDTQTGDTVLVSLATDGMQGNGPSTDPAIAAAGSVVAFESEASNLVSGDTNQVVDIFVHEQASAPPPGEHDVFLPLFVRAGGAP